MTQDADKLILTMLRKLDAKVELIAEDIRDLKTRVTGAAEGVAIAQRRIDRLEERVARVESDRERGR